MTNCSEEKQMKNLMAKLPGWDFSFLPGSGAPRLSLAAAKSDGQAGAMPRPVPGMLAADDDVEQANLVAALVASEPFIAYDAFNATWLQESLAPYFQWWEPLDGPSGQLAAVRYVADHMRFLERLV